MKKKMLLSIALLSVLSINTYAQKVKLASADKKYDSYAYIDAIKTYEKVAEKGYKSAVLFQKLGNAYYFNSNLPNAAKWYAELFALETEVEAEYYFRYSQCLRATGDNAKANDMMEKFDQLSGNDSRGSLFKKNKNYLEAIKENSGRYKIENAGINSKYVDYGAFVYDNKIYFATARDTGSLQHRKHSWNDQYFTNLYMADLDEEFNASNPNRFSNEINTKFHEASPVFTKDGKTMYFTRNNYVDGKKGKDGNNITLVKIYKATLENDKWSKVEELPFNSNNYSTGHPSLSPDEKTMYFASDMPGSYGQSDLFKVQINEDGTFGNPENLGAAVNTPGKETFPFVTDENEIYFASNGHPGLGGLDVFVAKINKDGSVDEIQNVGADVNSPTDDFAYIIDTKSRRGFFSSNRDGGDGFDDIYKFLETKRLICEQELFGKITDMLTSKPLPNAKVTLFDNKYNELGNKYTDSNGDYTFAVECGQTYRVRAQKEEYMTKEDKVSIPKKDGRTELSIALEKEQCKVTIGDDLGKCFGIRNIYFDFDKSDIRVEAAIDLEKILDVMNQYPKMKLDIRSHTDSRGSFKYNESLSDRRAKSTIAWLIKNGVSPDRLIGKGYGEYQLVNECADGVKCSEEAHQLNRRSEFIITAL